MKNISAVVLLGLIGLPSTMLAADPTEIEALKRELRELRQRTEQLEQRLQQLDAPPVVQPSEAPATVAPREKALEPKPSGEEPATVGTEWSPTDPITLIRSGRSYMNIGFDALVTAGTSTAEDPSAELQLGGHDPFQRGFSMANAEIILDGAVDPYFTGFADFVFKLDEENETILEAEELYLKTSMLPWNLQLRVGQYFAGFGRHNPQHPHAWAFVDQPIILSRTLGPEGLRNIGAELSWLAPTPFFTELTLSVMNGNGEQSFLFRNGGEDDGTGVNRFRGRETTGESLRSGGDLLFVPRLASSFDLTDQQTLLVGTSAAFGPNQTGASTDTQIYGADLFWKWKSATAEKGFPFVAFQTEGVVSRFEAGADPLAALPAETLWDYGFYSQILWGFKPRWVAGLRGEWADGDAGLDDPNDVFRNERYRIAPNLTWYLSEFSKVRLQYNYDEGDLFGTEHSVWMQFEFQLGAHSPHRF